MGQALDGGDLGAVGLDGQARTGLDRGPVHTDDAGAALAGIAANLGAGKAQVVPEVMHQQRPGLHLRLMTSTVDG